MLSLLWGLIQGLLISWKRANSIIILYTTIILIWFSQDKFCHLEADVPKFLGFTIARRVGQKSWAPVPIFFVLTEFGLNGTDVGFRFRRINRCRIDFSGQRIDPSEERMRASARSCGAMAHGAYWPLECLEFDARQWLRSCSIDFFQLLLNYPDSLDLCTNTSHRNVLEGKGY